MPSATAIQQVWIATLVAYFIVVVVVATMLTLILMTARQIRGGAAAIWTVGQKIANNTIHIALLIKTNHLASDILATAGRTAEAVSTIEHHAATCRHCPTCLGTGLR